MSMSKILDLYLRAHTVVLDQPKKNSPRGTISTPSELPKKWPDYAVVFGCESQAGAKKVAQASGIKLFLLDQRKRGPNSQITEFSWLIYRYDPPTQMMNVTSFRPDFDLRLEFARDSLPTFREKPLPRDLRLFDGKGVRIGTVGDVVSEFTTSMQKSGARVGRFTREFKDATFLKKPDEDHRYRLNAVKADVRIIEEPLPSFPLLPSGIVEFILEDVEAGTLQTYRRKKL